MNVAARTNNCILNANNVLVVLSELNDERLAQDFFGTVITASDLVSGLPSLAQKTVYLCGDMSKADRVGTDLRAADRVLVIKELSHGYEEGDRPRNWPLDWEMITLGQVPISVHDVGVYYRRFFDLNIDYFNRISEEHAFQSLTESNKPGKAHRTGVYLTPVERDGEELHFRLLRCSTNLSGPTENFRASDRHIVDALNRETAFIFQNHAPLNHVLAQIYRNTPATEEQKQTKAKIKAHADKTKDMPENGIMAFCTFYDQLDTLQPLDKDAFDYGHKNTSGLTRLDFRLKKPAAERPGCTLPEQFTVTLYPNSVFLMPLSTNRLYTHEIRSSMLEAEMLPTRLGYVVRCSETEAVHKDGQTFLKTRGERIKLEPPTPEGMVELRQLYAEENRTDAVIDYRDKFLFSMNQGDYKAPTYTMADEIRQYDLSIEGNLFEELRASVQFEDVGKGRQGTVLINLDEERGVPIVRTTTQYEAPAQCFRPIHRHLARQIQRRASLSFDLNNALIEHYTNAYTKMGLHSDQALDLADESFIAVFSCYKYPELATPPRMLVVEPKDSGDPFKIPLSHNSVVVFSLDTNRRFKHKIVLDTSAQPPENPWLGMTFRTSKTFVQYRDEQTYFADGTPLTLANDDERHEFYSLRRRENQETDFAYPRLTYTVSESDLMPPVSG